MNEPVYATKQELTQLRETLLRGQTLSLRGQTLSFLSFVMLLIAFCLMAWSGYRKNQAVNRLLFSHQDAIQLLLRHSTDTFIEQIKEQGLIPPDAKDIQINLEFDDLPIDPHDH